MKERTWFRAAPGAAALEQKKNTGGWFFIVTGVIIGLLFIITAYPMNHGGAGALLRGGALEFVF
jgi:uncharacterized integral membrane protein